MPVTASRRRERGGALVLALALLALAAALLAGSAQVARSASRSTESHMSAVAADAETRRTLAAFLEDWSPAYDSIVVGQDTEIAGSPRRVAGTGLVAATRLRLLRVSVTRYVVGLDVVVTAAGALMARRRISLIMERPSLTDTTVIWGAPRPIAQWGLSDLF